MKRRRQSIREGGPSRGTRGGAAIPDYAGGRHWPQDGGRAPWWFNEGKRSWRVGDLTPEQRELSIWQTMNDTMLVHLLETGWRPRDRA